MTTATAAPWTPPAVSPPIWFDFFPTTVTFPATDRTYDKARIIVTANDPQTGAGPRLHVFTDGPTGPRPVVIAEIDPTAIFGDSREGFDFILTAPAPNPIHVQTRPMHNCGCGSQLKSFRPFPAPRHTPPPASAGPVSAYDTHPGVPLP